MKTITTDPVCGMKVEESAAHRAPFEGAEYLFCSAGCRAKFLCDPREFIDEEAGELEDGGAGESGPNVREKGRGTKWTDYIPLMVIIALTLLAACAKQYAYPGGWSWMPWMHDFMGFFLVVFSMFKFFNMKGFADGFHMYDILAKAFRPYGYVYPFLELALGLGYLAHWQPGVVYTATVVLMVFGSLGVLNALRKGLDLDCACMGTVLKVPLSTVALLEDLGMAAMAAGMIFMR
jgi:YHS domain-containing protein